MCGIAGFIGYGSLGVTQVEKAAKDMAASMSHRGPDDEGIWTDWDDEIALAFRRLAVIDLSPKGRQPMQSASKRYWMVFNGEIYNHLELRKKLESSNNAPKWRGHSDTETLLAAIDSWGLEEALRASTGMFALGLWDCREKTLCLARDRMGEKPLYYGEQGGSFLFASELAPITAHPAFKGEVDIDAVAAFMQHDYIPAPLSIYRGVKKLEPGRILAVEKRNGSFQLTESAYWSLAAAVNTGFANRLVGSGDEIFAGLEDRLRASVDRQMVADVPVGAFLSGGIDSSLVVALMQDSSSRRVNTFSIGFDASGDNDEAPHAKAVAKHLGTDHTELYVTPKDMLNVIPNMPGIYGEPFADASQIPTCLLTRMARKQVTVALTGDGGDELFGGYTHYPYIEKVGRAILSVPGPARIAAAAVNRVIPWQGLEVLSGYAVNKLIGTGSQYGLAYKMRRLNRALTAKDKQDLYFQTIVTRWDGTGSVVPGSSPNPTDLPTLDIIGQARLSRTARAFDMNRFLPDDILVKVDRAAMHVSLETRIPMLDHGVVEYGLAIPDDIIIRDGIGKHPLREILHRHVPRELVDRPKMGFGPPIRDWLRGELRDWAEELLDPGKIRGSGILNERIIGKKWREFVDGRRDWSPHLWNVLMLQAWHADQP